MNTNHTPQFRRRTDAPTEDYMFAEILKTPGAEMVAADIKRFRKFAEDWNLVQFALLLVLALAALVETGVIK